MSDTQECDRVESEWTTDSAAIDRTARGRRPFLQAAASAISTAAVAGCIGDSESRSDDTGDDGDSGDEDSGAGGESGGDDSGAGGDASGGSGGKSTATSGGSTSSGGGTATGSGGESCPLGGGTTRFDASGTPFVFHFEYDTGFQEPTVTPSTGTIELPVEGAVGGAGNVTLLQSEPGEPNGIDVGQGVITTTTYDGETVEIEEISEEGIQIHLPYRNDEDGVRVQLTFGTGEVFPCTLSDLRDSAIRIAESMEPNPDNTQ